MGDSGGRMGSCGCIEHICVHMNEQKKVARGEGEEIKGRMFGLTCLRMGYLPSLDPHPLPKKGNKMAWKEQGGGWEW